MKEDFFFLKEKKMYFYVFQTRVFTFFLERPLFSVPCFMYQKGTLPRGLFVFQTKFRSFFSLSR